MDLKTDIPLFNLEFRLSLKEKYHSGKWHPENVICKILYLMVKQNKLPNKQDLKLPDD